MILVGDELLSGRTRDVNLQRFSNLLAEWGIPVTEARVVRDVPGQITEAARTMIRSGRVLIITGGMGPTDDDLTVQSVADAFDLPLARSCEAEKMVRSRQELYGLGLPESALKQADIPEGSIPVLNTAGIAPGIVLKVSGGAVICLPGVPSESAALLVPCLNAAGAVPRTASTVHFIRTWGLKENALYDRLRNTAEKHGVVPGYLPSPGRVDIKVSGTGSEAFCKEVEAILGRSVYSRLRDETLEEVLGRRLMEAGFLLSTAESCTGGGIGRGITSVPGSSEWYCGGVVSYSDSLKTGILGVRAETISKHGAVSGETAIEMARGVLAVTGSQCSVAVTGIAGPTGGTDQKPVGTVWTAAVTPGGERTYLWRLGGTRESVREGASGRALGALLELLS